MIKVDNITKYYGKRLALDNVSFNINKGEIVGLLGLNGAGKTTLMRIMTGYFAPSRGDVWISSHNILTEPLEAKRLIGYLPEIIPLYTDMTIRAYLDYAGKLRGLSKDTLNKRIKKVIDTCQLEEYADTHISKLSKGYKQRVGLAQAIIHDPEVLILDEPTVGIDPIQVAATRELIKDLGKKHTVIISSHILSEISAICKRVIIVHEGKIAAEDRIDNLSSLLSKDSKTIRLEIEGKSEDIIKHLRKIKGITQINNNGRYYNIEYPSGSDLRGRIIETIVQNGFTLITMDSAAMSLEDIFLKLTIEEGK